MNTPRLTSLLLACFLTALSTARGANLYFDTSNASGLTPGTATWDVGGSAAWATSTSPGAAAPGLWSNANDAFFQTGGTNSVTIGGTVQANSVTQTTNGTTSTISGGTLQLGNGTTGSLTNSGNLPFTANSAIAFNGATTISTNSPIVLGGAISGTSPITKSGSSSLTLNGTNGSSGSLTVAAGTLRLGGSSNAGLGTGTLILANGATVQADDGTARIATNTLQVGNANVGDAGSFTIGAGGNLTFGALVLETQNQRTLTVNNGLTTITGSLTHGNRFLTKAGPGALVIAGTTDAVAAAGMAINSGLLAVTGVAGGMNTTEELKLNGGVFGTHGSFTRGLGTGNGQVQWAARDETGNATASGGFAAYGVNAAWGSGNNLSVNIGGSAGTLAWGSTGNFVSGGNLLLGHALANGTVTWQNPINLNVRPRTVQVTRSGLANAGTDAVISGALSNGIIVKTGNGILSLTSTGNTASRFSVNEGTLSMTTATIPNTSDVWLTMGATLDLPHGQTDTIDQLIIDGTVQGTGTWGSLSSSATNKTALISGTGILQVSSNAVNTEPPVVENQPATSLTANSATLNAVLLAGHIGSNTIRIYYGPLDGGTNPAMWQHVMETTLTNGTAAALDIANLQPDTVYYFRAYAENVRGSDWADATGTFTKPVTFPITEVLPVNTLGLLDEDGTAQPWIEIWNPSATSKFSLSGYRLVHGATQWNFPAVEITPGERMIIFASGKNRTALTSPLHTNFTLSASGGTVALQLTNGTTDNALPYPALAANVSFGRESTEPALVGSYTNPTPGSANNYSGSGVAGKVTISASSRAFTGTLNVTLSPVTPVAGAAIRYTTNGTVPRSDSPVFSPGTPIVINATCLLRARVFEAGKLPGETESAGYLLLDGSTSGFSTATPLVAVSNFGLGTFPDTGDQPAFMWVWTPAAPDNRAHFTNLPTLATRCAVDRRGSSTLTNPKTNFNLEVRKSRDNDDQDIALLGMPAGSDWVFHAPYSFDRSCLHNPFFYGLSNMIGRAAMRTRMAEVFVEGTGGALTFTGTSSGDYFGAYNVMEKIRRGNERIDVAKLDTYENDAVKRTGGYLFKVDRLDSGDTGFSAGSQTFAYYYPKEIELKTPQRDPQEQYLTSYINSFKTALDSANYTNPATGYAAWLDVPAAIDHHLMNVWTFNVDGLRLSGYLHKQRGGKLAFGPVWDVDRGLSSTDGRDANPLTWRSQTGDLGTDFFNYSWWNRLFNDPDFYQKYIDRWVELRRGAFSQTSVNALLEALNTELTQEAVDRDVARWGQAKRAWTSPFTSINYPASQAAELQRLKDYLQQRANFFDSQWVAPVTFSAGSGNVNNVTLSMNGPTGATIYYTLNGTDPRPSGGGAPNGAGVFTYSGSISITATTKVRARAYHAGWTALTGANNPPLVSKWSGPTEARFSTDAIATASNVAVTEVNYNPSAPTAAELAADPMLSAADFEFLELKNLGNSPVDLGGLQVEFGITFRLDPTNGITLAPGAFAIIAANPTAFSLRYPGVPNVLGPFAGDLSNGGERLVVRNGSGTALADFTYNDAWHPATDGGGRTLAIYNPTAPASAFSTANNWRASAALGGSPGANEPNLAPVVNAGADFVSYMPGATLVGTVDDDALPAALTSTWQKLTGVGTVHFDNANATSTPATFSTPGQYALRLNANDGAFNVSDDVTVTMRDTPGAWLLRNPGLGTLNDDADGDGRPNWLEWALSSDPFSVQGGDGTVIEANAGQLSLTYKRQKASPFMSYTVQATSNPASWPDPQPGEISETILADDGVTETVRAKDTAPFGTRRFMRLRVQQQP